MVRGRRSKILPKDYIERLERFRRAPHDGAPGGYGLPMLRSAMSAPFTWETLQRALDGLPVAELTHAWLVAWIDKHFPAPPVRDGKMLAAGRDTEPQETLNREDAANKGNR
jgi:hypothetical protein